MAQHNSDNLLQDPAPVTDEYQELLEDNGDLLGEPPEYELYISADKVTVLLDCPDPLANLTATVTKVMADFGRLEIPVHPEAEQVAEILQAVSTPGCHLRDTPLIMGQKAVPSRDGRLDWTREFFTEGWAVDEESGIIDFWEKLEDLVVHENELLVKLFHPVAGESGLNVFGNEIPVSKPAKVKLRCGKGVRTEETEDGVEYYAAMNGRIRYSDGTVTVDDVYLIKGNVSLATGNIHHSGTVQIQGDVEAGATINAEGDVMIKGMVDPCTITCGGTLTVAGGLLGDPESQITVGGDLNARYINEANIKVGGNVTVSNEITHSVVKARGLVHVPKGRVAGGIVQGYKGVRVAQAGASGASETHLISGVDFEFEEDLEKRSQTIKKLEEAQEKIQEALKEIESEQDLNDPSIKQLFEGLTAKAKQQGQTMADEFARIKKLTMKSKQNAVQEIHMFQEVWSGTKIQLGEYVTKVKVTIEKPRIAQLRSTRVRVLPLGDRNMPSS